MKKNNNKLLLFIIIFFILFLSSSFFYKDSDSLYYYQWALKNDGICRINENIISNNYIFDYFDYYKSNQFFSSSNYDTKYEIDFIKSEPNVDIDYENAYNIFSNIKDKQEVIIALIDSGLDIDHIEIKNNIWTNTKEIPFNNLDDDNNGYIDDIHGYNFLNNNSNVLNEDLNDAHATHAAGTIVSVHNNQGIKGISYDDKHNIKIMPIKILDKYSNGNTYDLCKAIEYAADNGAKICNISLGSFIEDSKLYDIIKKHDDILFVVAAGNGENFIGYNIDINPVYPATYTLDNLITVSNLSFDGNKYVSSNFGKSVDIFAPGTYILSCLPGNLFGYYTGTSMAAPFVSASAAMIMSSFKNMNSKLVKHIILSTAQKDGRLSSYCITGGRLNLYNAMKYAQSLEEK